MPDAACLSVSTPVAGNKINGINDVAGIGSASVAHHHAVKNVMAAVADAANVMPLAYKEINTTIDKTGPMNK